MDFRGQSVPETPKVGAGSTVHAGPALSSSHACHRGVESKRQDAASGEGPGGSPQTVTTGEDPKPRRGQHPDVSTLLLPILIAQSPTWFPQPARTACPDILTH
jgi:hypothetical protein